ncbi:hypothetical protein DL93DRAFT_2158306 [Clavulina sp. PMI_390]|nr:hypothetical protein DL93DRAFT_2158306 [Clavulina sp. PMI_390]
MTRLFRTLRFSAYLVAAAFDIVVLGLTANFAAKFLPLHRDFLIFSLTCCALTLVVLMVFATGRGYPETWNQSISNLGWYGEETGSRSGYPYTGISQQQPYTVQPGVSYTYPNVQNFGGSQPVYQLPGHSVVITNGPHGQSMPQDYNGLRVTGSLWCCKLCFFFAQSQPFHLPIAHDQANVPVTGAIVEL